MADDYERNELFSEPMQMAQAYVPPDQRGGSMTLEQLRSRDRFRQNLQAVDEQMRNSPEFKYWLSRDAKPMPGLAPETNADFYQRQRGPGQ
jgi:hypothetical protein